MNRLAKQIISIACSIFLSLLFYACKKPGCFGSAGNITIIIRPLPSFNELVIADNINLVLTQGAEEKMEIEGPQNIIANITGTVLQNILTISNKTDSGGQGMPMKRSMCGFFLKTLKNWITGEVAI